MEYGLRESDRITKAFIDERHRLEEAQHRYDQSMEWRETAQQLLAMLRRSRTCQRSQPSSRLPPGRMGLRAGEIAMIGFSGAGFLRIAVLHAQGNQGASCSE